MLRPLRLGFTSAAARACATLTSISPSQDLENAIPAIRQRLRAGNVPKRSWILFFDDTLAGEWIGIYDDTLPPPTGSSE